MYQNLVYDCIVVGSGPAGAMAAYQLSKHGLSTLIIEKETLPRYKTCGGGLVFRGRKLLPFAIDDAVEREFFKVNIHLNDNDLHLSASRNQPIISMVMRDAFDYKLVHESIKNGAILLENCTLQSVKKEGKKLRIGTSQGLFYANVIVAADGVLSTTAKLTGWEKNTRTLIPALEYEVDVSETDFEKFSKEARFDFGVIPFGYGWVFPKKEHLSIGVASFKKGNFSLKECYSAYLKRMGLTPISQEMLGFQIPVRHRQDGVAKNGVLLVGDAAGFPDPVTAEGISNALLSGRLAAEAIIENLNSTEAICKAYQQKIDTVLVPALITGQWLSNLFYTQNTLRNAALKKYGTKVCEAMTDVFMGERQYPANPKAIILKKMKDLLTPNIKL